MKEASGLPFASVPKRLTRRIRLRKQAVQERSKHTTEAIHQATLQVLLRDGYSSLTTTRVAARAGVAVGTLYQYFPDKRSLVVSLKVRYFARMLEAFGGALAGPPAPTLDALFRASIGALLRVKQDNRELTLALRTPMTELGGADFSRDMHQNVVAHLKPAIERVLGREVDERKIVLLVAAVQGAIEFAVFESPDWLGEPWFLDDLVRMATGTLEPVVDPPRTRRPKAGPRRGR